MPKHTDGADRQRVLPPYVFDVEDITEWRGQDVVDADGERIGKLEEVYFDCETNEPGFGCVRGGLFGRRMRFVPLRSAAMGRDYVRVAFTRDQVRTSPAVATAGQLTGAEEIELLGHYGLEPRAGAGASDAIRYRTEAAAIGARAVDAPASGAPEAAPAVEPPATHGTREHPASDAAPGPGGRHGTPEPTAHPASDVAPGPGAPHGTSEPTAHPAGDAAPGSAPHGTSEPAAHPAGDADPEPGVVGDASQTPGRMPGSLPPPRADREAPPRADPEQSSLAARLEALERRVAALEARRGG